MPVPADAPYSPAIRSAAPATARAAGRGGWPSTAESSSAPSNAGRKRSPATAARSWRCACGANVEVRRTEHQRCSECAALRTWARQLTHGSGRRLRSLERWAERVARNGRRSWRCACGAELPDPINCVHCADCARVRYWARQRPKLARLDAERRFGRESGDWICSACGDFQGPAEHTRCTKCGCDVTSGEPDPPSHYALHVTAKVEHLSAGGVVVWNGAHGTPLLEDGPAGSSLAWIAESATGYRVRPEMWR